MEKVNKFVISRKVWLRGEGPRKSRLLRTSDGKMCCLGIYMKACGVEDSELVDRQNLHQIDLYQSKDLLELRRSIDFGESGIYFTNDDKDISEEEREGSLKQAFKLFDIKVSFKD